MLGVFGREGVFAAAMWPLRSNLSFHYAAFDMYLNYDGQGGAFGDTSVSAVTSNNDTTSLFASVNEGDPAALYVVAINKTDTPQVAEISVAHSVGFTTSEIHQLTEVSLEPEISHTNQPVADNQLTYTLPPMSVSTLVLR